MSRTVMRHATQAAMHEIALTDDMLWSISADIAEVSSMASGSVQRPRRLAQYPGVWQHHNIHACFKAFQASSSAASASNAADLAFQVCQIAWQHCWQGLMP